MMFDQLLPCFYKKKEISRCRVLQCNEILVRVRRLRAQRCQPLTYIRKKGGVCEHLLHHPLFSAQLSDYAVVDPWNHHRRFDDRHEPFCWDGNIPNCHGGKYKCKEVSKNTCRMQRIRMASETFDMQIRLPHCAASLPHCLICRMATGSLLTLYLPHCLICRMATGSVFALYLPHEYTTQMATSTL